MSEQEATGGEATLLSPEPATTSAWYGEESAGVVESKGWKTADDAIKSYTELEKMSSGRVKMPDFSNPEQNAEEIRAFYQKTGCPENPEGYTPDLQEGSEKFIDAETMDVIRKAAWDSGTSNQAFSTTVKAVVDAMESRLAQSLQQGEAALKEEFGDKYDENLSIAQRFVKEACSPEFLEIMDTTGLGNNPVVLKEFINLGKKTMADTLIKGQVANSEEAEYVPRYADSPEMYATGEDEESVKARAWHTARGHKY
jgi:hypothetical protein